MIKQGKRGKQVRQEADAAGGIAHSGTIVEAGVLRGVLRGGLRGFAADAGAGPSGELVVDARAHVDVDPGP